MSISPYHPMDGVSPSYRTPYKPSFPPKPRQPSYSKRDFVTTIRPLIYLYRIVGLAPYSTQVSTGKQWNPIGVAVSLIWLAFFGSFIPFFVRVIDRLLTDPIYCGLFGSIGLGHLIAVIQFDQIILHIFMSIIFARRTVKAMTELNGALVIGLSRVRRVVIFYIVSAVALFLGGVGFAVFLTHKHMDQFDLIVQTMFKVRKGALWYNYYLFGVSATFPVSLFLWTCLILNSSMHVLIAVAFVQQFRHIEMSLKTAVTYGQFESLRKRYFFLRRCLADCDDILSYRALLAACATTAISCVSANAEFIFNTITKFYYVADIVIVFLQVSGFCAMVASAIWLNEKARSISSLLYDMPTHPPEIDACVNRWLRNVESQAGDLTIGKIFVIDRASIMTLISVAMSGIFIWYQLRKDTGTTTACSERLYEYMMNVSAAAAAGHSQVGQ